MIELDLRNKIGFNRKPHYWFEANGARFGYCYIRKNACTCFKNIICDTSENKDFLSSENRRIDFMNAHHRINNHNDLKLCDTFIFVYRDPYERLVSAFVNKFVVRDGSDDILNSYRRILGDPQNANFRKFVSDYCKNFRRRDYHIRPQVQSLLPIKYDSVISISNLHESMRNLIGAGMSEKYFFKKENETRYGLHSQNLVESPAGELRRNYLKNGSLPSPTSLLDNDLKYLVMERYADDYMMIEELRSRE